MVPPVALQHLHNIEQECARSIFLLTVLPLHQVSRLLFFSIGRSSAKITLTHSLGFLESLSNINTRCKILSAYISFLWCFLCAEHRVASLRDSHTIHKGGIHTVCSFSNACALLLVVVILLHILAIDAQTGRSREGKRVGVGWGGGGGSEGSGALGSETK